jgi:hypothetical protein
LENEDPLPIIELAINLHNEYSEKVEKYENENKQLRDALKKHTNERSSKFALSPCLTLHSFTIF